MFKRGQPLTVELVRHSPLFEPGHPSVLHKNINSSQVPLMEDALLTIVHFLIISSPLLIGLIYVEDNRPLAVISSIFFSVIVYFSSSFLYFILSDAPSYSYSYPESILIPFISSVFVVITSFIAFKTGRGFREWMIGSSIFTPLLTLPVLLVILFLESNIIIKNITSSTDSRDIECSSCGASIKATHQFCQNCGERAKIKSECPECGRVVPKNADFCPSCGNNI